LPIYHFASTFFRFSRDLLRIRVVRQHRQGDGNAQSKDRIRGAAVAPQIIQKNRQLGLSCAPDFTALGYSRALHFDLNMMRQKSSAAQGKLGGVSVWARRVNREAMPGCNAFD